MSEPFIYSPSTRIPNRPMRVNSRVIVYGEHNLIVSLWYLVGNKALIANKQVHYAFKVKKLHDKTVKQLNIFSSLA